MKRIDAITRCKGILAEVLNRKSARITRQVDQAIDMAKDKAQESEETADEIINSFGKYSDSSQTKELQGKINEYIDKQKEALDWEQAAKILEALKVKLQQDVEVVEEEEKK